MTETAARRLRPGAILALVCGAQFMVVLDIAIVNVALPSLQVDLDVAQSDLQWVVITYGLTLGGFLLLGGRVADLFGRRNVLVAGLALFTAASLAAGLSNSLGPLVAARAVQGLGAALAAPAALSILASTFAEGPSATRRWGSSARWAVARRRSVSSPAACSPAGRVGSGSSSSTCPSAWRW